MNMLAPQDNNLSLIPRGALAAAEAQKAVAEIQAALTVAKMSPRNEPDSRDRIMRACQDPNLAKLAVYDFPRGGQKVSGPSIRLAEAVARHWGNLQYGFNEINRQDGESEFEAFCWDLETNTKATRKFFVRHIRDTKQGGKKLTDERDIYELGANQAQRRVRACIMQVIPKDIFDDAVEACEVTSENSVLKDGETIEQVVEKLLKAFAEKGVTKTAIEKRIGRKVSAIQPPQIHDLRKIFTSLKDGFSEAADWFDLEDANGKLNDALKGTQDVTGTQSEGSTNA